MPRFADGIGTKLDFNEKMHRSPGSIGAIGSIVMPDFVANTDNKMGEKMNGGMKAATVALLVAFVGLGCSYQRKGALKPVGLPEYVYKTPVQEEYVGSYAGVFNFRAPEYAGHMGRVAGECLYEELLKRGIFARLTYEAESVDLNREKILAVAKAKGYELVITGDLLYYFEGSLHYPSRVDQRMEVIGVDHDDILWYAKAVDIGPCYPFVDYLVVEGYGRSAPSTRQLFERNAKKFCELLYDGNSRRFPTAVARAPEPPAPDPVSPPASLPPVVGSPLRLDPGDIVPDTGEQPGKAPHVDKQSSAASTGVQASVPDEDVPPLNEGAAFRETQPEKYVTAPIHFAFNDYRLSPEAKAVLRRKAEWLKRHPGTVLEIQGHCDERGTVGFNTALGTQRAACAKGYLVELGIAGKRLMPVSYGEKMPVDKNHNEAAWAMNRRAEFAVFRK